MADGPEYKQYMCLICGFIYNESEGWPDDEIAPGTKWEDVPDDWVCPDCSVGKDDFENGRNIKMQASISAYTRLMRLNKPTPILLLL